jgi:hypothetical protein
MGRTSTTPIKMTRPVDDQYVSMNRAMHNWPVKDEPPTPPKMVNFATVRHGADAPYVRHVITLSSILPSIHCCNLSFALTYNSVPAAGYGSVLPRHGADRDLR